MELSRLNLDEVEREIDHGLSEQELALIPEAHRTLACELRTNNNLLRFLLRKVVSINNVVVDHNEQLSPLRFTGKAILWIVGSGAGLVALATAFYYGLKAVLKAMVSK